MVSGTTHVSDLCSDHTLRELHRDLYAQVWQWAGVYRTKEYSIGIDPTAITASVRDSLTSALYRWANTDDWTPKRLAVFVHADIVRIHPFLDGNGRVSRLLSDLIYLASQGPESLLTFDWDIDKKRYIELLREYDRYHDERPFADFLRDIELPV